MLVVFQLILSFSSRLAVVGENADVARLLLDAGADPNAGGGEDGETPLDLTSDLELVGMLLEAGARSSSGGREMTDEDE